MKRHRLAWWDIVAGVVVVSVIAAVLVVIGQRWEGRGSVPAPLPSPLPSVVDDPQVVDAIDLLDAPVTGVWWEASDGVPSNEYLQPNTFVTPCGVLVTELEVDGSLTYAANVDATSVATRIVGYEIKTGKRLWVQDLSHIGGLTAPSLDGRLVTFTTDCRMLFAMDSTRLGSGPWSANLAVDLRTGDVQVLNTAADINTRCQAAGAGWAACHDWNAVGGTEPVLWPVDLSDPAKAPGWTVSGEALNYQQVGDLVVKGMIWSPEGYRDPATGAVKFGSDTIVSQDHTVAYVEPTTAGLPTSSIVRTGLPSGVVVRCEKAGGDWSFTLWDTATDTARWDAPKSSPALNGAGSKWSVVGQALLVTTAWVANGQHDTYTEAASYVLADGRALWHHSNHGKNTLFGRSEAYPVPAGDFATITTNGGFGGSSRTGVRLTDGAKFSLPTDAFLASTMAYTIGRSGKVITLTAYSIVPSLSGGKINKVWSVPFQGAPLDETRPPYTFATEGAMYVVVTFSAGGVVVHPLAP